MQTAESAQIGSCIAINFIQNFTIAQEPPYHLTQ